MLAARELRDRREREIGAELALVGHEPADARAGVVFVEHATVAGCRLPEELMAMRQKEKARPRSPFFSELPMIDRREPRFAEASCQHDERSSSSFVAHRVLRAALHERVA